ncbi:hypothetical protein SLA2020_414340 [Shorea laevis]
MANTKLRGIFFLLAVSFVLSDRFVGGRIIGTMEGKELAKHKGTELKPLQGKNGDMIDCVDIYQQPAFDHPLLKDHIIQMEPNSIPKLTNQLYDTELFHGWLEHGQCPEGTIPIRHAREGECHHAHRTVPPLARRNDLNVHVNYNAKGHEYATAVLSSGDYYGAHAKINVWQPLTMNGDVSISQIWIVAGSEADVNTIEAGWKVDTRNGKPKFFIYWTGDGYANTGCFNLDCPGFVQVNKQFVFGTPLEPVSTYGSAQYDIGITVHKVPEGKWWLQFDDKVVGYWPESIFTHLASKATGNLGPSETKSSCYSIDIKGGNNGTEFYFGGPGYSAQCP